MGTSEKVATKSTSDDMPESISEATYSSPIGAITISTTGIHITKISFAGGCENTESSDFSTNHRIINECIKQLDEYFLGHRESFSLPLMQSGTAFQQSIRKEILEIPYGKTDTYGSLAQKAGRPLAARAVGQTCNRNPFPIIIPCHRVIGSNGNLTGFAGGIENKKWLLNHEKSAI